MAEAEDSIKKVCQLDEIVPGKEWIEIVNSELTKVLITMGRERRDQDAVANDQEIRELIAENSKRFDPIVYTDGSVRRGIQSGWGFVLYVDGQKIHEASGATERITSSMRMEVEAISRALQWIVQSKPETTHAVIVTDSQSTLRKVEKNALRREWMDAIRNSPLRSIKWIYCPGHAGIGGNEKADQLATEAVVGGTVGLDKTEIVRLVEDKMKKEEEAETNDYYGITRMKEMGVKRGEGRKSTLGGRDRRLRNQMLTGTISEHTLRAILGRGTEHVWSCSECSDVVT